MTIKSFQSNSMNFNFTVQDEYGGQKLSMHMNNYELDTALQKLPAFIKEYEEDKKLRESNPAVKAAYESYRIMLALAHEDKSAKTTAC
jgi:hypothetical protein